MQIDNLHFTPWAALAGGVLLGLAASLFILVNGRILGISGIVAGLLRPRPGELGWRIALLLGLISMDALAQTAPATARPLKVVAFGDSLSAGYGLPEFLRISLGTREHNQRLLQALDGQRGKLW